MNLMVIYLKLVLFRIAPVVYIYKMYANILMACIL